MNEGTNEVNKVLYIYVTPVLGARDVESCFPSTVSSLTTPSGRSTVIRVAVELNMTYKEEHRTHPGL